MRYQLCTLRCILIAATLLVFVPQSNAQQDLLQLLGTPPANPTMPIPNGFVNLKNGNVHLEFPLLNYAQRNGAVATPKLIYDSLNCYWSGGVVWFCNSSWQVIQPSSSVTTPNPWFVATGGASKQCFQGGPWYSPVTWNNFLMTDSSGTTHSLPMSIDNNFIACHGGTTTSSGNALDGTGYEMSVTLSSTSGPPVVTGIWDKSGNPVWFGKDVNGNYFSSGNDELGRNLSGSPYPTGGVGTGQWAGSTIQWVSIPAHTNFSGTGASTEFNGNIPGIVSNITLPDGRTYQFTYDSGTAAGHYGNLLSMTLPTGGVISFGYTNINPSTVGDRRLTSLALPDGTWTIAYNPSGSYNQNTTPTSTTITPPVDPSGKQNQSVYAFPAAAATPPTLWTQKFYSGSASGTPLREIDITRDAYLNVTQVVTILDNLQSSKVVNAYTNLTPSFFRLTSQKQYDFSGNLVREIDVSPLNTSTYVNANILDKTSSVTVYGSGGSASTPIAQANYSYDGTTLTSTSGSLGNSVLGATNHDNANYGTGNTLRGNLTSLSQMVSSGTFVTTSTRYYNILGELIKVTDGRGNSVQYDYTDKWSSGTSSCVSGATFAYPTTITYPTTVTNKTVTTYNACDATVYSSQDQNDLNASRAGTVYTYDGLQRVTNVTYSDGGNQQTNYDGTAIPQVISNTTAITSSTSLNSQSTLDGLGRSSQTALTTDPDGTAYSAQTFDALGRSYKAYNPTRCTTPTTNCGESTWGYSTTTYDALGRATSVTAPDGQVATTTYTGPCSTTTDPAAKARKLCNDALGRLIQVFEDPSGLNYETDYTYDALDNLLTVTQKGGSTSANWRTRTFAYDSLSRLTSASNPESGTATYTYDTNGNVLTKTSPKPNQTGTTTVVATYTYDPLNRVTQKSFNDSLTPTAKYGYDGVALTGCTTTPPALMDSNPIGYSTSMCDGAGAESWSHDSMGRVLSDSRTTNGITYAFPQTYSLDGSISTVNYGNYNGSETVTFQPGGAGRPLSETTNTRPGDETTTPYTYVWAAHYAPNGALCGLSYYGNNAAQNVSFNNRFQPVHWHVTETPWGGNPAPLPCQPPGSSPQTGWTASWLDFWYNYVDGNGHNNGNVASIWDEAYNAWSPNFTYDSLNRLATAQTYGTASGGKGCWAESYTYDAWGNLLNNAANPTTQSAYVGCAEEAPSNLTGVVQPNNRLSGMGYTTDSAGNLIADGVHTFTYDAENHLLSTAQSGQTTVSYQYDGDGKRVLKSSGTLYWYGLNSQPLLETTLTGGGLHWYYYFNGRITNRRNESNFWYPDTFISDALGNTNVVSGLNPGGVMDWSTYYPFGGEWVHRSEVGNRYKFTGKERDPESNLDNFLARYYTSSLGRFMSPDPDNAGASPDAPQSWNAYSYVLNNPLNAVDPDGLWCVYLNDSGQAAEAVDANSNNGECGANGGYWIAGDFGGGSLASLNINVNNGTVTGVGYAPDGSIETSVAGAMGSSQWGAWTQSYASASGLYSGPTPNWAITFFGDLFSWQSFGAAQIHAQDSGYYNCLGNKMIPFKGLLAAGGAKLGEEALTHAAEHGGGKLAAGAYYHFTDGRFTAWGRASKVLVPEAAATISKVSKGISIAGWLATDIEGAHAIHACSEKLEGN